MLENPAIDFDNILLVKRSHNYLGMPLNFHSITYSDWIPYQNNVHNRLAFDNTIQTYSLKLDKFKLIHKAEDGQYLGEVDLHFNAKKMMFTGVDKNKRFQVYEKNFSTGKTRQVSPSREADIDNFDSIYLPDERVIFNSTTGFNGVPCHDGQGDVGNLHIMNNDGSGMRRLCFEQDHNWYPTLLPNGRVLYLRWEYTDSAHYFSRILMQMNPDGSSQREFYGSNSYWPNTMFYARPLPGTDTKFVAIVSGHHGTRRAGELHLFDVSKGRREDKGVVQQIPGRGKKVVPRMADYYVDHIWPKFLHPYPISDKYFLVAGKMSAKEKWGLYLVDVYDNIVLIKEDEKYALLEPIPLKKSKRPPVLPDVVNLKDPEATCFIQNIYQGPGLEGVPEGTVKKLRIFQYEYGYRHLGGHYKVGMEGGWDVKRILGTVPVYADGSAMFKIPANTPISIQPLDKDGRALQLMRSWMVGMPGEVVSCIGCHESQNEAARSVNSIAATCQPVAIKPWYGPVRGLSFTRDVQPVLDKYCIGCHDGKDKSIPDFVDQTKVGKDRQLAGFPQSYMALHPYVRRNGPEGDYRLLTPLEFHVSTSKLIQMLEKGHHNVKMDKEGWDRLTTWVDMNVPCYGTWSDVAKIPANYAERRKELKQRYAGVNEDVETLTYKTNYGAKYVAPKKTVPKKENISVDNWPFSAKVAKSLQKKSGKVTKKSVDLGGGQSIELVKIPSGKFVMGGDGEKRQVATIAKPFWIGKTEVSLEQFRQFRAEYKNGWYDMHYKDQVKPGYNMNFPKLPVIRVSWNEATRFCQWLSKKTGLKVSLPTE